MKNRLILLLLLAFPLLTRAQEGFKGEHYIEVTGAAQTEIEPNEIYVLVRLKEFEENRQKTSLEKLEQDFFAALKQANIDRKRLELADAGARLDKLGKKDKDAFREKSYQLKLTSATELETFLEKLEPVKTDLVDITKLSHSDYEKIKTELKTKALIAAKAKAETLLKAIGAEIGKPLMVRDWEVEPVQPMMQMRAYKGTEADIAGAEPQIGFKKIKMQAQITAQFEIK
jgi:uncharacterized protein YggE